MLKMKSHCERCQIETGWTAEAYICSFECTFCAACTTAMQAICPNWNGELVKRPTRLRRPVAVAASQLAMATRLTRWLTDK